MINISQLKTGDHLLYKPSSFFGWLIAIKTWTKICHIEIYKGDGLSWASRDGIGVNVYPFRYSDLVYVRRPKVFNADKANEYFNTIRGQKYDWMGILCFTLAVKQGSVNKMFCSELALNLDRHADNENVLSKECIPDHTAPSEFLQTPELETIYDNSQ